MDKTNWLLTGLAALIIGVGLYSKQEKPASQSENRTPASEESSLVPVKTKKISPSQTSMPLATPAPSGSPANKLSYLARREKWIHESAHIHKWDSPEIVPLHNQKKSKFGLYVSGRTTQMSYRTNQLIFINAGRRLDLHICPYSGVTLNKLVDHNQAGTFYFQEGHILSFNNLKRSRFCSITLAKKTNIKEKVVYAATVLEKKADFRHLPQFTGVRHYFARDPKNQVIEEISCYTPVFDPKNTEYDDLEDRDMAFAFYTLLDF